MLSLAQRISRAVSILLLAAGLVLPWYHVPTALKPTFKGGYSVSFDQPGSTLFFKVIVAAILLGAVLYIIRKAVDPFRRAQILAVAGAAVLLLTVVAYPAFTIQRCARVSAHGEWLEAQNNSMILSNGDSLTSEEYSYQSHEPAVLVTEVLPRSFQAVPTVQFDSPFDLHLANLPQMVMWLGYTAGFCQFVGRGWFCFLFGALFFVVSFVRQSETDMRRALKLASTLLPGFGLAACLLWGIFLLPVLLAGWELTKSERAADHGRYDQARQWLHQATAWLPIFAYNTDIIYQEGWFDQKLGISSPAAKLVTAMREEEEGYTARAVGHYTELLTPENPGPVRDEAYRGALRRALTDLNAGLDEAASASLTRLLMIDPSCVKANYALQLADLRRERKEALQEHVAEFEAMYNSFQSLEKSALLAAAHRRLAELDFDDHDVARIGDDLRAAIKP